MELIRLENICKTYYLGEVEVPVLHGVSLSIRRGEMVALMGASGSGKTTLMNILGCLDHATSGEYWLDGQEMSRLTPNERALVRTEKLGFVFQNFNLWPATTAVQNVVMPLDYARGGIRPAGPPRGPRACSTASGLADRVEHEPSQMSGGQQQRVAIGRALVNRPHAAAGRRADGQSRFAHQRGNPADVPATQCRGDHGGAGDARSAGGRLCPSHHPHRRRADRARETRNPSAKTPRRNTRMPAITADRRQRPPPPERPSVAPASPPTVRRRRCLPATWRTALGGAAAEQDARRGSRPWA